MNNSYSISRKDLKAKVKAALLMAGIAVSLPSCGIYDNQDDCGAFIDIRFVYDMNMSGGDGFPAQVSSINLWLFDHETGRCVGEYSDSGEALSKEGYRLRLSDIKPGRYDFIAWGGLGENASFSVPSYINGRSDLNCTMHTIEFNRTTVSNTLLTPLFYGSLEDVEIEGNLTEYTFSMPLMKDTNNINISLQHLSDEKLDASEFSIFMVDANGDLNYDNSLAQGARSITYYPWSTISGAIDFPDEDLNYVKAELSTCRLMADSNPVITIVDNDTHSTVYSIPIVEWAKKLRSMQNLSMEDQEYLDREHEYSIMLYLADEDNGWKTTSIVINGFQMSKDQ